MPQEPLAIGMSVCEQVIIEEKTRNVTPVNCFSKRTVNQFPSETIPFVVFTLLTGGVGEMPVAVTIHRLDTFDEIYKLRSRYRFASPLHEVRCVVRIRGFSFPIPGHYQITLFVGNEIMALRKIQITQKENPT